MHLPISHLSGYEEDVASEDLLQAHHLTHSATSNDDEAVSHNSQSQGSAKETKDDPYSGGATPSTPTDQLQRPLKDLPCPRCESMNTKFCYYNNYSVNQPRHFCRNCQRYWTVGGTLRNVPVGGGSRKKSSRSSSRARSDPYYRGDVGASTMTPQLNEMSTNISDPGACSFSECLQSPFLHQFGQLPFPFTMSPDEEAELRAFSQQAGMMSTAAAMMGSGLWVPDLEPTHVALMQKAALWAEAQQRLQTMARRALWADDCKPSHEVQQLAAISPPTPPIQRPPPEARLHRRPGFWETALMHSRREPKPEGDQPQATHHNIDDIPPETNAPYSQRVESPTSLGRGSVNSESMFY